RIDPVRVHVVPHVSLDDVGTTGTSKITTKSTRMTETAGAGPDDDRPTVLFFGRIWEYKGLEYLIRAEPLISAQVPGVKIVIARETMAVYHRAVLTARHPRVMAARSQQIGDAGLRQ